MPQANDGTNDVSTPDQETESTPRLLADGGNKKVIGKIADSSGIGVYGYVTTDTGTTCGVKGEVDSSDGYGLATPNDAKIEGVVDTGGTDFVVTTNPSGGDTQSVVMGHENNEITNFGVKGGTITGGGSGSGRNKVHADYSTVSGGVENEAGDPNAPTVGSNATVGGGFRNTATANSATVGGGFDNDATNTYATIGGGTSNEASDGSSTVSGGNNNNATNTYATVGGGTSNEASGDSSTVPGGNNNAAKGKYSFAAGHGAKAKAEGSFVWSDNFTDSNGDHVTFGSADAAGSVDGVNSFNVRATGGARIITSADGNGKPQTGVEITNGDGSWSSLSDASAKSNVSPVDPAGVLADVDSLSISEWTYKSREDVEHMGPMAGEFHETFGLGASDQHISNVDADGVALAAIQGLSEKVDDARAEIAGRDERIDDLAEELEERDERIDDLEEENTRLHEELAEKDERIADLEDRLAAIETQISTATPADD